MNYLIIASLLITGIIHLLPLSGVMGIAQLERLYGAPVGDETMELLLRHRAVMFGLLGGFFIYAAFKPSMQLVGVVIAIISVSSFMILVWRTGLHNAAIMRVFWIDAALLLPLTVSFAALMFKAR